MRNCLKKTLNTRWIMVVILSFIIYQLPVSRAAAQDEPEYRMELGGGLGLAAYQGDLNGSLLRGMKPMGALVAKYKVNPRMAWDVQLAFGSVKGSTKNTDTWYPVLHDNPVSFNTSITSFTVRYEYNFWPFGTGQEYLGAKPLTPFIAFGTGLLFTGKPKLNHELPVPEGENTVATPEGGNVAFQMPIGLGVKYKLKQRLNLTVEWMMHFTGTDKMDGLKDPYGIKSSGLFKNTDSFSTLQVSVTYDLWAKCKTCHNDRE